MERRNRSAMNLPSQSGRDDPSLRAWDELREGGFVRGDALSASFPERSHSEGLEPYRLSEKPFCSNRPEKYPQLYPQGPPNQPNKSRAIRCRDARAVPLN